MATVRGTQKNDTIYGTDDADILHGNKGDDTLYGGAGADRLHGGVDDDTIFGGDGDDFIVGGQGWDELFGGSGADTFYYNATHDSGSQYGFDTIGDFETGIDTIDLTNADADTTTRGAKTGSNEAFTYVESTDGVTPGHLTLSYNATTGITTLNGYTDAVAGADFTVTIVGQVNPSADILF